MLYLDYAKPLADGKYILSFFADSAADLESISHGQKFVTKNGTDYGVPQAGSTVIVTSPNSGKTTYVMDAEGIWVVTEDISYSAVVANPSDVATAKLEKLKVNDTTYANWTESEIKALAGGPSFYNHLVRLITNDNKNYMLTYYSGNAEQDTNETLLVSKPIGGVVNSVDDNVVVFSGIVDSVAEGMPGYNLIILNGINPGSGLQFMAKVTDAIVT